jgi:hypothetical protein
MIEEETNYQEISQFNADTSKKIIPSKQSISISQMKRKNLSSKSF